MADYTLSAKITGDAKGFEKAFATAQRTVSSFEKKMQGIGGSISKIGDKLTSYITKPAVAATTALAGITLVKGWNRLKAIDEAKAKLTALGNNAESVAQIMESANASVKGTSYGLDEAATTAANAVAAGIKPGKELTRYLSLTADAAAVAGTSMLDMGSIINKVQTAQRAYTEEINMLADRSIPIYQWLADEAGISADAVRDMARDGKISSKMFLDAIEKNIGGAAQIMGETSLTGAIANIWASVSRIGANFLDAGGKAGGFFSTVKPLLAEFKEKLVKVEEVAADLGEKFGNTFNSILTIGKQTVTGISQYFKDGKVHIDDLSAGAENLLEKILPIIDKLKPLADAFSSLSTSSKVGFGAATIAAGPLFSILGKGLTTFGTVTNGINGMFTNAKASILTIPDALKSTGNGIKGLAGNFSNLSGAILQPISPLLKKLKGKISGGLSEIWTGASKPFKKGASVISESLSNLIGNIGLKFPKLTGIIASFETNSKGMFGKIGNSMQSILKSVAGFAPKFLKSISIAGGIGLLIAGLGLLRKTFGDEIESMLQTVTEKGHEVIEKFCSGIASKIPDLILQGGILLEHLLNAITANLPAVITGGISIIAALVSGLASELPILIPAAVDMIITIVTSLIDNLDQLIDAGINLLIGLVEGIMNSLPKLISAGFQIISSLKDTFFKIDWFQIGKDIMGKIRQGILNIVPSIVDAVKDIANKIKNVFSFKASVSAETSVSGKTSQLAHGTDYWQGGFAYMNEGGRGELTYLPNGTQVIPHDISVKYAKEAAHRNTVGNTIDTQSLGEYIITAVTKQAQIQSQALEKGISGMSMVADNREVGRFFSNLGFAKA